MGSNSRLIVCSVLVVLGCLWAVSADGQDSTPLIELVDVPGRLVFPMEAGRNVVLTAKVPAADVREAWLSPSRGFPGRVMMVRTGESTYQINLAEEIVYRVLQANKGEAKFYIFAEDEKGVVYGSLAISYVLAEGTTQRAEVRVWTEGEDGTSQGYDVPYWYAHEMPRLGQVWVSPG